ncbi:uncharacterized protein LOC102806757, partial [Saccoglossus kowalevskii]|uniref:Uncharacterized protein LOC102806757 n=1 Tax=Saccoglossus kowalevskii TaxID=10224 RepID=A0ABM0MMK0_SACKO
VYCVMLIVDDVAGNHNRARRFLIFDDVNAVDIDTTDQYPMWVDSAAENTSFLWQTDLQDTNNTGPRVVLRWTGHFYNWFHRQHKFLNAIEDDSPPLTSQYEEVTGQPPATRSREAIPNINAIVRFEVNYDIDNKGGRTISYPSGVWSSIENVMHEFQHFDVPRNDGDSIHLWVRATDVMGNSNQDDVLIHVDSSRPEIHNISSVKNVKPSTLRIIFQTYDDHSGVHTIQWHLMDLVNVNVTRGSGQVVVKKPTIGVSLCELPNCACIPKDDECYYRDYAVELDENLLGIPTENQEENSIYYYSFTITTTNNAMLTTTRSHQIAVNASSEGARDEKTNSSTVIDIVLPLGATAAVVVTAITIIGVVVLCRRKKSKQTESDADENTAVADHSTLGGVGHVYDNIAEYEQGYMSPIRKDIKMNQYESVVNCKQQYADVIKDDITENVYETPTRFH